jgi:hypothetical protein
MEDTLNISRITHLLNRLRDSCLEGLDGTWDCSTEEGREAFQYMSDDCEEIAAFLNIKLEEYQPND